MPEVMKMSELLEVCTRHRYKRMARAFLYTLRKRKSSAAGACTYDHDKPGA